MFKETNQYNCSTLMILVKYIFCLCRTQWNKMKRKWMKNEEMFRHWEKTSAEYLKYFIYSYFLFPRIIGFYIAKSFYELRNSFVDCTRIKVYLSFFCCKLLQSSFKRSFCLASKQSIKCSFPLHFCNRSSSHLLYVCFFPVFSANFRTCDILRMHAMCHIKDSHSFSFTLCTHIHTHTHAYKHK